MYWSRCAGKLGLLLALSSGCGQQSDDAVSDHIPESQPASTMSFTSTPGRPTTISDDLSSTSSIAPDSIAPEAGLRRLPVALADRTITGQLLPEEIKKRWSAEIRSLEAGDSSLIRVVTNPADADWLIQIAALARTDIVYLAPANQQEQPIDDELLRMFPPGEAVIPRLQAELEHVARHGTLSAIAEQPSSPDNPQSTPPAEEGPETGPAPSQIADPHELAYAKVAQKMAMERQRAEQLREQMEKMRAESEGAVFGMAHRGSAEDLKAEVVEEQDGIYHTPNRTQAVLGTYGKMVEGNRLLGRLPQFEHRGIVQQLEQVRRFTTVQRVGSGAGKDFVSFLGNRQAWQLVDLTAQLSGGRHQEVAFEIVGVRLDQNDVIKVLNADDDALRYFDYLRKNKLVPCFVLENLVFASYTAMSDSNLNLGAKAGTALTSDGIEAGVNHQRSSFTQLTSPVIRCYQAYEVKTDGRRIVELVCLKP